MEEYWNGIQSTIVYECLSVMMFGCKDTCRKSYVMRPLSDRKICEQHLIAHFQWRFLRFQIEFLHSVFCNVIWTICWNKHCYEQMIATEAVYWGGQWLRHGDGYLFEKLRKDLCFIYNSWLYLNIVTLRLRGIHKYIVISLTTFKSIPLKIVSFVILSLTATDPDKFTQMILKAFHSKASTPLMSVYVHPG